MAINLSKLNKRTRGQKVFVGLSGGVDSSVAALLLKDEGYEVTGVFMKNWSDTKDSGGECNWVADRQDAMRIAAKLGIPFKIYDFEKEYKEKVLKYLIEEYKEGRTPNPDIMCNKEVKFKLFLDKAVEDGADFISTGHYAKVKKDKKGFHLLIPKDKNKDQTYFIYVLNQEILKKTFFPLANLTKKEVRSLAKKNNLVTANKKDSTGICFVGEVNIHDFLKKYMDFTLGNIVDDKGNILGKHDGLESFTIGQREGLKIGGTGPYYVVSKDFKTGNLIVTNDKNDSLLYSQEIKLKNIHWISGEEPDLPLVVEARFRHLQKLQLATIQKKVLGFLGYKVIFKKSQRAVASGQSLVVYRDGECLGGGVIG